MKASSLRAACVGGFLYGAIVYGDVLSWIHVVYNRLSSGDALVTWLVFNLLYGFGGAAIFAVSWAASQGWARLRRREAGRGARLGVFLFNLGFWQLFWLYGLTYDQYPWGRLADAWGMLGFVALLVIAIAVGVFLVSWLLVRLFDVLARRGWLGKAALAASLVALAVHAAAPLYLRPEVAPAPSRAGTSAPRNAAADTGLKVVLVGLDGADWQVLGPMIERGELPAFAGLKRQGVSGPLATLADSNSAVIWTSIYTGVEPERHEVLDFYRIEIPGLSSEGLFPVHRTYFKELAEILHKIGLGRQTMVNRYSVAALPIWDILDHAGLSIGLVDGYFYSFPAIKPSHPESYFLSYGLDGFEQQEGGKKRDEAELFVQPFELFRGLRPLLRQGDFYWQSAVTLKLLGERPQPRFLNVYTHEPDTGQHLFWKWFQPRYFFGVTEEGLREHADHIPKLYRDFDGFLAKLRARVGPETVVIVASDHGHAPTILHRDFYTQHRHGPPGILLLAGGPVKPGAAIEGADIYDLYPTILYLLGLPVPEDATGRVLLDALDPAFVRAHPVQTVPTWQTLGPARGLPGGRRESGMNEEELEKLKALGYI